MILNRIRPEVDKILRKNQNGFRIIDLLLAKYSRLEGSLKVQTKRI